MLRNNADVHRCSYFELGLPVMIWQAQKNGCLLSPISAPFSPSSPTPLLSNPATHTTHNTVHSCFYKYSESFFFSWAVHSVFNSILLSCKYHFWRTRYRFNFHYKMVHRSHGYCIHFLKSTLMGKRFTKRRYQGTSKFNPKQGSWWKAFPGAWEARGVPLFSLTRGGLGPKFPYPTLSNACQAG